MRTIIIGPEDSLLGGVSTHMRVLKKLGCFRDALFIDPGSLKNSSGCKVMVFIFGFSKLFSCLSLGTKVLINVSIYPGSLAKLWLILALCAFKRVRTVDIFFHGGRISEVNRSGVGRAMLLMLKLVCRRINTARFLSRVQLNEFNALFSSVSCKIYRNYSEFDSVLVSNASSPGFIFLFVGRIEKEKGIYDLLQAFEEVAKHIPNANLKFVGEGSEFQDLNKACIGKKGVEVVGYLQGEDLNREYAASNCVVLPSYSEGFPYVFIEAMRAGKPIVATNVGALADLVDSKNGFLVGAGDVNQLIGAMLRVYVESIDNDYFEYCSAYFKRELSVSSANRFYNDIVACD
jgi:glycosyltransferase involved in cell wall biosynthesis